MGHYYDYDDYDDYGYRSNWRPEMPPTIEKDVIKAQKEKYRQQLDACSLTWDEAVKLGENYQRTTHPIREDGEEDLRGDGPYTLFIRAWFNVFKEDEMMHQARMVMNHFRHNILDYDDCYSREKSKWWLTESFSMRLWETAMDAIYNHFSHHNRSTEEQLGAMEKSYKSLCRCREFYFNYEIDADFYIKHLEKSGEWELTDKDKNDLHEVWYAYKDVGAICAEQEAEEEEKLIALEEEAEEKRKAGVKAFRQDRSAQCRKLTKLWKNADPAVLGSKVQVKYRGRMYDAIVVKINPTKIKLAFQLKSSKKQMEIDTFACYLLDYNPSLPVPDDYTAPEWDESLRYVPPTRNNYSGYGRYY